MGTFLIGPFLFCRSHLIDRKQTYICFCPTQRTIVWYRRSFLDPNPGTSLLFPYLRLVSGCENNWYSCDVVTWWPGSTMLATLVCIVMPWYAHGHLRCARVFSSHITYMSSCWLTEWCLSRTYWNVFETIHGKKYPEMMRSDIIATSFASHGFSIDQWLINQQIAASSFSSFLSL